MDRIFQLAEFLPYQLAVLSERVSHRLSVDYGRMFGLTMPDWRVLVHLQDRGPVSVREIQEDTNLEKSRVSRAVARLVEAGLVAKVAGVADARLVEISLTKAGQSALAEIIPAAQEVEARIIGEIDAKDLAAFQKVSESIHRALDADPDARARRGAV